MLSALSADAACHVSGVGAVLEVVAAGLPSGAASRLSDHSWSVLVSPHTWLEVRSVAEHRAERLAAVDDIEELLPHLGR
jgi:hypothetical protein